MKYEMIIRKYIENRQKIDIKQQKMYILPKIRIRLKSGSYQADVNKNENEVESKERSIISNIC